MRVKHEVLRASHAASKNFKIMALKAGFAPSCQTLLGEPTPIVHKCLQLCNVHTAQCGRT
jgi:hypothetical protein